MQAQLIVVTKAAEQKQSEEQKLLQYDDGNNWYGKDPILRLIHTLDIVTTSLTNASSSAMQNQLRKGK